MHAWLSVGYLVGVCAWAAGLSLFTILEVRGLRWSRRLYYGLSAPGLYLFILSGVWALHATPALLKSPGVIAAVGILGLAFGLDAYIAWGLKRGRLSPRLMATAGVVILSGAVILFQGLKAGGAA